MVVLDLLTLCMAKRLSSERIVLPATFANEHRLGKELTKLRKERAEYISDPPDHSKFSDVDLSVVLSSYQSVKKGMLTKSTYMYVATNKRWDLLSAAMEKMWMHSSTEWECGWIEDAICGCVQVNDTTGLKMCLEFVRHWTIGDHMFLIEVFAHVPMFTNETVDFLIQTFDMHQIELILYMVAQTKKYNTYLRRHVLESLLHKDVSQDGIRVHSKRL